MRVIAGEFGGRRLVAGMAEGLRPAMDRTREAIFSMLEAGLHPIAGARALDLFAGSGSLGIECLSRGAELAWFVDNGRAAIECLHKNIAQLGIEDKCGIHEANVIRFLRKAAPLAFDLVFIDPPYRRRLLAPSLDLLFANGWLNPGAVVLAEIEKELAPLPMAGSEACINRLFGQTRLCAWKIPA